MPAAIVAHATRLIHSWLATTPANAFKDNPNFDARFSEIRMLAISSDTDSGAGDFLYFFFRDAFVLESPSTPMVGLESDLMNAVLNVVDWNALGRAIRFGEELDDVDID